MTVNLSNAINQTLAHKILPQLKAIEHTLKHGNSSNGYYGKYRVAARGFNKMFGDVWRRKGLKLESDKFWQKVCERLVKDTLAEEHSNASVPWGRVKMYGKQEASLLNELNAKKKGKKIKEMEKRG